MAQINVTQVTLLGAHSSLATEQRRRWASLRSAAAHAQSGCHQSAAGMKTRLRGWFRPRRAGPARPPRTIISSAYTTVVVRR